MWLSLVVASGLLAHGAVPPLRQRLSIQKMKGFSQNMEKGVSCVKLKRRDASLGFAASVVGKWLLQKKANAVQYDIKPDLTPDSTKYDPNDSNLYEASQLLQKALNAEDVAEEERLWTEVIRKYENGNQVWVKDIVGRAYGNRGNARARQGKMQQALDDYDTSSQLCPWAVDPVLNRGVALEALGRFEEAIEAYEAVLKAQPNDPAGWNNLG
mmetsp:Transcript_10578/g.15783  ORF Transcript_10578/g.15783 Transcript_10578/m.15783 type:complete len:212 (+) Transcript_10578:1-636(+)